MKFCKNLISKDEHCKSNRLQQLEHACEAAQNVSREENHRQQVSGATLTPLMRSSAQFVAPNSTRVPLTHQELSSRELTFFTRAIDYHGESTTIGTPALLKILKSHEHPSHGNDEKNHSEDDLFQCKFFKPRFLDANSWHPGNTLSTIHQHYSNGICRPDASNAMPNDEVLFASIRKRHCNCMIAELETRNVVLERTKQNSEEKSVKVGVKSLVTDLKNMLIQMKKKNART